MRRKGEGDRRRTGGEEEPRRGYWGGVRDEEELGVYEVRLNWGEGRSKKDLEGEEALGG